MDGFSLVMYNLAVFCSRDGISLGTIFEGSKI